MTVDPFKGGSSATLFVPVGRDAERELRRAEAVRGRALVNVAGLALGREDPAGELREVLEALGLIGPQIAATAAEPPALPRGGKPESDTRAFTSAGRQAALKRTPPKDLTLCGKQLHPMSGSNVRHTPDGMQRCKACAAEHLRRKRAHEGAQKERTNPDLCPKGLHRWAPEVVMRRGTASVCRDCHNATRRSGAAKRRARLVTEQIGDES